MVDVRNSPPQRPQRGISNLFLVVLFCAYSLLSSSGLWDLQAADILALQPQPVVSETRAITVNSDETQISRSLEPVMESEPNTVVPSTENNQKGDEKVSEEVPAPVDEDKARFASLRFELETSAARSKILADNLAKKNERVDALVKSISQTQKEVVSKSNEHEAKLKAVVEGAKAIASTTTKSVRKKRRTRKKSRYTTRRKRTTRRGKTTKKRRSKGTRKTYRRKKRTTKYTSKKKKVANSAVDIGWSQDFEGHPQIDFPVKQPWTRPPVEEVVDTESEQIVGDVTGLIDVAILGQAKCGTTFIQNWLKRHDDAVMFQSEECSWLDDNESILPKRMYTLPDEPEKIYGIKCPFAWKKEPLMRFQNHYKKTRLVFGVRHPIRWFKSLYDHKNKWLLPKDPNAMPNANELIGDCDEIPRSRNVCTDRANYHQQLALLGKTPLGEEEMGLFPFPDQIEGGTVENPLFLYELEQFSDTNTTRHGALLHDLETFIGLPAPFPERGSHHKSPSGSAKLEICDPEYDKLRRVLLKAAQRSAFWIRNYLLKSETVYVSNREHFLSILDTWDEDPCDTSWSTK